MKSQLSLLSARSSSHSLGRWSIDTRRSLPIPLCAPPVSASRMWIGHDPERSPFASTNDRCAGCLWTRYRAVQSGNGASSGRPLWSDIIGSSAPDFRMSKFAPVGVLTRFVTTDARYGGMALAWLNGPISGVIDAYGVEAIVNVFRQRVR